MGEVGIGGGIREWNVEFILPGAQLFILIFPVSCCVFLILGLNPGSTPSLLLSWGGRYCGLQSCFCAHHLRFPLLQAAHMDEERSAPPPQKCQPQTADPLCIHPRVTGAWKCVI